MAFNISFFQTDVSEQISNLQSFSNKGSNAEDSGAKFEVVSSVPYEPKSIEINGYDLRDSKNIFPTKITLDGVYAQKSEKELEQDSLDYKKKVIEEQMRLAGLDLQSSAFLMKALLDQQSI